MQTDERDKRAPAISSKLTNILVVCSLLALLVQNTVAVFVVKASFRAGASTYFNSSVVYLVEWLKFVICAGVLAYKENLKLLSEVFLIAQEEAFLVIPSIMFTFQGYLILYALEKMTPMSFLVCSQLKTIATALFSYILLNTFISKVQAVALLLLTMGVIFVQSPLSSGSEGEYDEFSGFVAVLLASLSSGFASVFLEKIYKSNQATLLEKNIKLSVYALPVATCVMISEVGMSLQRIFHGFDAVVIAVVIVNAAGGLIISATMTYASNILKCFTTGASICLVSLISAMFGQVVSFAQISGTFMVSWAIVMYAKG
tara:strand:- start:2034 stop:2978 length:945 start_codon:yes stop_codon:yes gene_type:complete